MIVRFFFKKSLKILKFLESLEKPVKPVKPVILAIRPWDLICPKFKPVKPVILSIRPPGIQNNPRVNQKKFLTTFFSFFGKVLTQDNFGKKNFAKYQLSENFGKILKVAVCRNKVRSRSIMSCNKFCSKQNRMLVVRIENWSLSCKLNHERFKNFEIKNLKKFFLKVFLEKFSILFKHKKRKGLSTNSKRYHQRRRLSLAQTEGAVDSKEDPKLIS